MDLPRGTRISGDRDKLCVPADQERVLKVVELTHHTWAWRWRQGQSTENQQVSESWGDLGMTVGSERKRGQWPESGQNCTPLRAKSSARDPLCPCSLAQTSKKTEGRREKALASVSFSDPGNGEIWEIPNWTERQGQGWVSQSQLTVLPQGSGSESGPWTRVASASPGFIRNVDQQHLPQTLQYICCCLVAKSSLTLCNLIDYSPPDSSVHGISQARTLEWVAISFSRGSSQLRDQTHISCTGRWGLYHWATWEAHINIQTGREEDGKREGERDREICILINTSVF